MGAFVDVERNVICDVSMLAFVDIQTGLIVIEQIRGPCIAQTWQPHHIHSTLRLVQSWRNLISYEQILPLCPHWLFVVNQFHCNRVSHAFRWRKLSYTVINLTAAIFFFLLSLDLKDCVQLV